MELLVIESPFAPAKDDPRPEITLQRNVAYVRAAMRMAFMEGFAPYASHALYTLPGVLIDTNPDERRLGMRGGFSWGKAGGSRWIMDDFGISSGMESGIKEAEKHGQRIIRRQVPGFPELWLRSVAIFDVLVEVIDNSPPPSILVHLDDETLNELEKWAMGDINETMPAYIYEWHRNPESALPPCFKF